LYVPKTVTCNWQLLLKVCVQ